MPRVEIVQKHNTAARRLYIRGHNGKVLKKTILFRHCYNLEISSPLKYSRHNINEEMIESENKH
jgi:hypothetical protein